MKVYNLKFRLPTGNVSQVQIIAEEFFDAVDRGTHWIVEEFGNSEQEEHNGFFDILKIEELEGINVVNAKFPCDCPFCQFENGEEKDRMELNCANCGGEIKVAGEWEGIACPGCGMEIDRDEIVYSKGKWVHIPKVDKGDDAEETE